MSKPNESIDNLDIKTVDMPKGINPTAGMKYRQEYERRLAAGEINEDGSPKNGQAKPITPNQTSTVVESEADIAKKQKDMIRNHLVNKTEYNVMVNGEIKKYPRKDLNPLEHFELQDIIQFHNKVLVEITNLDMRKRLLTAKAQVLGNTIEGMKTIDQWDEVLRQLDNLNLRFNAMTWEYKGQKFNSVPEIGTFLYQKALEFCLGMTKEDFNKSAIRSNSKLAKEKDVYGTRHIADACIDVEINSYAYFQSPSESSSND